MIEFTPELERAVDVANGPPPIIVDRRTQTSYVLIPSEDYNRLAQHALPATIAAGTDIPEMSEGIRRAKAALRRDLPTLLASRQNRGKYVCYHLGQRIGIDKDYFALIRECNRRRIPSSEFIVERITPRAGSVEEIEIETPDEYTPRGVVRGKTERGCVSAPWPD